MVTNNSIDNIGRVWYFPLYDNNGNITDYVSEDGEVVASYEYDAFGRTIAQSGAMADTFPFRFSTKYYDAEAKLYYYGERFYSPEMGRWLNRDPIEEDGCCDESMEMYVAVVVSVTQSGRVSGHVAVITPAYNDDHSPYTDNSEVWILPPLLTQKDERP